MAHRLKKCIAHIKIYKSIRGVALPLTCLEDMNWKVYNTYLYFIVIVLHSEFELHCKIQRWIFYICLF